MASTDVFDVQSPSKAQPKSAAIVKNTTKDSVRGGRDRGRGRRDRTSNRPKPKTSDELDAEMADYFDGDSGANGVASNVGQTNGGVIPAAAPAAVPVPAPATNGIRHEGMDDGDLVCSMQEFLRTIRPRLTLSCSDWMGLSIFDRGRYRKWLFDSGTVYF